MTVNLGTFTQDGRDQFCSVFSDATCFVSLANHESRDVLQEHERDTTLAAQFNEVRAFLAGF